MENEKKYRVHAVIESKYVNNGWKPYLKYAVQKKFLGLFWITISEESDDKEYIDKMCDDLNKING